LLLEKFKTNLDRRFSPEVRERILEASLNQENLEATPVDQFVSLFVV
jgi:2-methylcitrate dehydratase